MTAVTPIIGSPLAESSTLPRIVPVAPVLATATGAAAGFLPLGAASTALAARIAANSVRACMAFAAWRLSLPEMLGLCCIWYLPVVRCTLSVKFNLGIWRNDESNRVVHP